MNVKNIIKIYTQLIDNKRPDIMSANVFYGPNRVIKVKSSSGAKRGQKLSEKYFYSNNKKCSNSYSDVASLASLASLQNQWHQWHDCHQWTGWLCLLAVVLLLLVF